MSDVVWEFNTKRYRIRCKLEPEDMAMDFDDESQMAEAIERGDILWFTAVVTVEKDGYVIGRDILGGCAYERVEDFIAAHRDSDPMNRNCIAFREAFGMNSVLCHYFPSMVRMAIAEARKTLA